MRTMLHSLLVGTIILLAGCPKVPSTNNSSGSVPLNALVNPGRVHDRAQEAEGKYNLALIRDAVRDYAGKHGGQYPASISLLGSSFTMPVNPISQQPMREVAAGSPGTPDDFTYFTKTDPQNAGKVIDFALVVYGAKANDASRTQALKGRDYASWPSASGIDWSHVSLDLGSDS